MKVTLKKICGDLELTIEAEGKDEKEIFPQLEFWTTLPTAHPRGARDFQICARPAKTAAGKVVTYYEITCPSSGERFCLGQATDQAGGGLFPKGWSRIYGQDQNFADNHEEPTRMEQPPSPESQPDTGGNTSITARPLSDSEMQNRAERFVAEKSVSYAPTARTYTVQVNDKIAYVVHKQADGRIVCECERFQEAKTNPKFKCEHIRAVAIFANSKPDSRNELKLLIAEN